MAGTLGFSSGRTCGTLGCTRSRGGRESPYSEEEVRNFLRMEYQVNPDTDWWQQSCSFCGRHDPILAGERASICRDCIVAFYHELERPDG